MFCPNCGKEIDDNANFCISCGKAISQMPKAEKENPLRKLKPKHWIIIFAVLIAFGILLFVWECSRQANRLELPTPPGIGSDRYGDWSWHGHDLS